MTAAVNPALLVLVREARGRTQDELSEQTGISQSVLSKYENALRQPSEDHLALIAANLGYPPEFFYRTDSPLAPGTCLYHRKQASTPRRLQREFDARINVERMHVVKLLDGARLRPAQAFPRFDIADYNGDTAKIAEMVRLAWRLPSGPIRNLVQAIERAGGLVMLMQFNTNKLSAICHPETPPMFFVNADSPADRFRFTLAHEIGHLVMHHVPTEDQEREADRFAADFLMPARDIAPDLMGMSLARAADLKPLWRVSMAALLRRARDLKTISDWQYQRFVATMSHNRWRLVEPVEIAEELPTLFPALVNLHITDLHYSVPELASMVGMFESEFRTRFLNEAKGPRRLE